MMMMPHPHRPPPPPPSSPIFLDAGSPFHAGALTLSPPSGAPSTKLRGASLSPLYPPAYEIWRDGLPLERAEQLQHPQHGFAELARESLSYTFPPGFSDPTASGTGRAQGFGPSMQQQHQSQ